MIKFVDIGKQLGNNEEWPQEFCFYCTIIDRFIEFNYAVYDSYEEFEANFKERKGIDSDGNQHEDIEDFKSLCPSWVFEKN